MVNKVVAPVIGLFFTVVTGFFVVCAVAYVGSGGGAEGSAAVRAITAHATGFASSIIPAVVNLVQSIATSAMNAIQ